MAFRSLCALLSPSLMLAFTAWAQADDDLGKFVEQNRVLAQKIKTEASQAMAQARLLEKTDAEQAQAILQKALRQVQNATVLSSMEQTQVTAQLLGRLREVGEAIRQQKVGQQQAPLKELPKKPVVDSGAGPSSVAKDFIDRASTTVGSAARIKQERDANFGKVVANLGAGAIPVDGEVVFPKDWKAKSELRKKLTEPQLSPKEIALMKALNSVMSVEFNETPLKKVIEILEDRTGQSIIVDLASLKEANTEYTDPVTFKANKLLFRSILRKVLADNNLTYVIKEGTLQVVTPAKAREMMTVRTYPISDLVAADDIAIQFGPFVARQKMLYNVQMLINTIQNSVDPSIWQANGGGGSIQFYEPGMALIIRAPTEFHYQFAGGMR